MIRNSNGYRYIQYSEQEDYRRIKMSQQSAQQIITNIITYSESHGNLLDKYNLQFYLNHFDRNHLHALGSTITAHRPLTQQDFIRLLLLSVPHPEDETLYLALSLRELFQAVLERTASASMTIDFSDLTTYLCEKISKEDLDIVISPRQIIDTTEESRQVCLNAPVMISRVQQEIPKISRDLTRRNKKLQEKRSVSKMFFSAQHQQIIALGSLSSTIHLFDLKLNQKTQVKPKQCREMDKQVGILSMGYCPTSHRIAAILTSGNLVFWEGSDGFTTEKVIPIKNYGDKVYFLEHANRWATASSNAVHLWDLREEFVTDTIAVPEAMSIMDICEVTHLGAICLSIVSKTQQKLLIIFQGGKKKTTINLGSAASHTLHYHKPTRSLVPLTYTNNAHVYSVTGVEFDPQLKYVLRGHKSIITCVDSLQQSTIMITGDDAGEIRVWQLTYMRCLQSLKLTRWLGGIRIIGSHLLYSDSRINLLPLEHFAPPPPEKNIPLYQAYSNNDKILWIFTKREARKIEIKTGRMSQIIVLCGEEEEISAAVCIGDGFIVGLSNGIVARYNSDAQSTWQKQAHEGEVRQLLYDARNRLIFSLGAQGRIIGWPQRNINLEQQRKIISFKRKPINLIRIASKSTILVSGHTNQKQITIWDYEVLSLLQVLQMQEAITAVGLDDNLELLMVATVNDKVFFYKYGKKQHSLQLSQIAMLDTNHLASNQTFQTQAKYSEREYINGVRMCAIQDLTRYYAVLSTNQGKVTVFDMSEAIMSNFDFIDTSQPRESVNILRNQKEEFQTCYSQRGHTQNQSTIPRYPAGKQPLLWSQKIGKDTLTSLSELQVGQGILGVLTQQYAKMVDIRTGEIKTSLHVSQPLPIKWNPVADIRSQLKHNLYQTLKIMDSILRNNGYQLLARQYKLINVTNFMELMKNCCFAKYTKKQEVPLISDKPLANCSGTYKEEPTLKALEAYKRVKAIKKISEQSMEMPPLTQTQQVQLERDSILQMLSPDSYSTLIHKYSTDKDPYIKSLDAKLNDSLLLKPKTLKAVERRQAKQTRIKFQDRSSLRETVFRDMSNISKKEGAREMGGLSRSIAMLKKSKQAWVQQRQQKSIKQILGDLNTKLRKCRMKHAKDIEL